MHRERKREDKIFHEITGIIIENIKINKRMIDERIISHLLRDVLIPGGGDSNFMLILIKFNFGRNLRSANYQLTYFDMYV